MKPKQIVLDTNVLVAALRSQSGASHKLLLLIGSGKFEVNISVPLFLEYEYVLKQMLTEIKLSSEDVDDILDYIAFRSNRRTIHYLWRPVLSDPKDDMVVELAGAGNCEIIVTFNAQDFRGSEQFGLQIMRPQEFLPVIGELS